MTSPLTGRRPHAGAGGCRWVRKDDVGPDGRTRSAGAHRVRRRGRVGDGRRGRRGPGFGGQAGVGGAAVRPGCGGGDRAAGRLRQPTPPTCNQGGITPRNVRVGDRPECRHLRPGLDGGVGNRCRCPQGCPQGVVPGRRPPSADRPRPRLRWDELTSGRALTGWTAGAHVPAVQPSRRFPSTPRPVVTPTVSASGDSTASTSASVNSGRATSSPRSGGTDHTGPDAVPDAGTAVMVGQARRGGGPPPVGGVLRTDVLRSFAWVPARKRPMAPLRSKSAGRPRLTTRESGRQTAAVWTPHGGPLTPNATLAIGRTA